MEVPALNKEAIGVGQLLAQAQGKSFCFLTGYSGNIYFQTFLWQNQALSELIKSFQFKATDMLHFSRAPYCQSCSSWERVKSKHLLLPGVSCGYQSNILKQKQKQKQCRLVQVWQQFFQKMWVYGWIHVTVGHFISPHCCYCNICLNVAIFKDYSQAHFSRPLKWAVLHLNFAIWKSECNFMLKSII